MDLVTSSHSRFASGWTKPAGTKRGHRCCLLAMILSLLTAISSSFAQDEDAASANRSPEAESSEIDKVPWSDRTELLFDLPARRMTHARELLNLLSVDESQLASFTDGEPLGAEDEAIVARILYSLPRFPLNDLQRWAQSTAHLTALLAVPADHRADTFLIRGRTTKIERIEVAPEAIERLEFARYFRVHVQLDGSPHTTVLCARELPAAWVSGDILGEPLIAYGLFLKLCNVDKEGTEFAFATPHIGWLPSKPMAAAGITADLVQLASLGMDVSLFDDVRRLNRKPVAHADRECFYQLLAALGPADADGIRSRARTSVDLGTLLQEPTTQHGRLMVVRGTARRAMKIRVDDEDIRERLGLDHYFQIDVFIPLVGQTIRLADGPTFKNSYPVTVCVLRLPPELPEGTDIREEVSIPAAFFKLWAYRSQFVSAQDPTHLQVSPMFMGAEPRVIQFNASQNPYIGIAVAGTFVAMLAFAWIALWRSGKNDSKFKRDVLSLRREVPPGNSLNDAGIEQQNELEES